MRSTEQFVADIETDLACSRETFGELERLVESLPDDIRVSVGDDLRDAFDRFDSLCSRSSEEPAQPLPLFGIRI
ncbi:MAG TPA: hypothetical protein VM580_14240 [Labilithrix sp.]|nr:hypothetical protein [Labilithrix sp.]